MSNVSYSSPVDYESDPYTGVNAPVMPPDIDRDFLEGRPLPGDEVLDDEDIPPEFRIPTPIENTAARAFGNAVRALRRYDVPERVIGGIGLEGTIRPLPDYLSHKVRELPSDDNRIPYQPSKKPPADGDTGGYQPKKPISKPKKSATFEAEQRARRANPNL